MLLISILNYFGEVKKFYQPKMLQIKVIIYDGIFVSKEFFENHPIKSKYQKK